MYSFLCIPLGANDLQIQMLLGLFNYAVGYKCIGLQLADNVRWSYSFQDG
jgi:hypothetical protein